jgi:hypothetical protein
MTIAAGSTQSYTATATDSYGNSWDVTADISSANGWSISPGANGSWNGATYTSATAGQWTVTANYLDKIATATLTVTHATNQGQLAYITASVNPTTVAAPNAVTGIATAYDSLGNSWDISALAVWSIPAGGDGGSWSGNIYTSNTAGTYIVQAAYRGKTATASLTVTHATDVAYLDHIVIAPNTATVNAGVSQTYTATAYDTFGNSWTVDAVYSCPSSNVVISGSSVYSNVDGVYTITGTFEDKSDTATLTVTGHLTTIESITVAPKTVSISAGSSQGFTATASDGYNTWDVTGQVTWSINSTAGGSWDQSSGTYTSANAGTWTVQATNGALFDTATLTVNANSALPGKIVISPSTSTVKAGTSQNYTATAYDQFGNSLGDVTSSTTFTAPGATVTSNSVTSNKVGLFNITATYNGLTAGANLTVTGYTVTFTENGLQTGTSWNITFGGQDYASSTDTITIDDASALSYSWSTSSSIQNSQTRYLAAQTSGSLLIPSQLTQNIDYSTQYLVTYAATGNVLSVSVPAAEWVNSGGQATGSFQTQVTNGAQDTRCSFVSDNRPSTITQPTTITGTYQTQYYLAVSSAYGSANGSGWYNSESTATVSLSSAQVSGGSGIQYAFADWSGDASGTTLTTIVLMDSPKTATASWNTQYMVTYVAVGNALPITVPSNEWVNAGSAAQGKFPSTVANSADNTQCVFLSDNRPQSITAPTKITGTYQTKYKVTFSQTGISSDAKGTILTVLSTPENYSQLADTSWYNNGTQLTFSFKAAVSTTNANKQYTLTGVNATSPLVIDVSTAIQGSYKTQLSTSLYLIFIIVLIIFAITTAALLMLRSRGINKKKQQNLNEAATPTAIKKTNILKRLVNR